MFLIGVVVDVALRLRRPSIAFASAVAVDVSMFGLSDLRWLLV